MIKNKYETKKHTAFEWFGWDADTRFQRGFNQTMRKFALKDLQISYPTLLNWKKEWDMITNPAKAQEEAKEEEFDIGKFLSEKKPYVAQQLLRQIEKGNSNSTKLYLQMLGLLVEKSEVKIGLSPEETARRNLEAIRQLREGGYRMDQVPEQSGILYEKLRSPEGLGQTTDSQMAALGSPAQPDGTAENQKTDNSL